VRTAKAAADSGSPAVDQLVFAELLARGRYDQHVARVRSTYRQRRDLLVRELARYFSSFPVEGAAAGLHVLLRLPGRDDIEIAAAAAARGVRVRALSAMSLGVPVERGLVLGYGRLPAERIADAVAELAAVIGRPPRAATGTAPAEVPATTRDEG
jgi:GntR family transcriptional regulator/MocR family aminotransferase